MHLAGMIPPNKKKRRQSPAATPIVLEGFRMVLSSRNLLPRIPHVDPCGAQVFPSMAHGSEDVLELSSKSYKSQPFANRDRHHVNVH